MKMFQGIYGFDMLSKILLILGFMFSFWSKTIIISIILLAIATFRAFSTNIPKRRAEMDKFSNWVKTIALKIGMKGLNAYLTKKGYGNGYGYSNGYGNYGANKSSNNYVYPDSSATNMKTRFTNWYNQKKNYKIVSCPKCGQKLRLPRGKGKIVATCKKCFFEFKMRT